MKKITKLLLGLAIFLLLAGGLLALAGRTMGAETTLETELHGYPVQLHLLGIRSIGDSWSSREYWHEEVSVNESAGSDRGARNLETLSEIDIDVNVAQVSFRQAEDYGVELEWNSERLAMGYSVENGRLTVWSLHDNLNSIKNLKAEVVVYLPQGADLDYLSVSVDMGNASLANLSAEELVVEADMGEVKLDTVSATTADLSSDMGSITGSAVSVSDSLIADCSMGSIQLSGALYGEMDLECDMGSIDFSTSAPASDYRYDMTVDMGNIYLDGKSHRESASGGEGDSYLQANCSMGDITVRFGA